MKKNPVTWGAGKSTFIRLLDEEENTRTYLLLWIFLALLVINIIWQAVEVLCYGVVQGRTVDSIIVMVFAVALVKAYYLGRDMECSRPRPLRVEDGRLTVYSENSKIYFQADIALEGSQELNVRFGYDLERIKIYRDALNELIKKEENKNV